MATFSLPRLRRRTGAGAPQSPCEWVHGHDFCCRGSKKPQGLRYFHRTEHEEPSPLPPFAPRGFCRKVARRFAIAIASALA